MAAASGDQSQRESFDVVWLIMIGMSTVSLIASWSLPADCADTPSEKQDKANAAAAAAAVVDKGQSDAEQGGAERESLLSASGLESAAGSAENEDGGTGSRADELQRLRRENEELRQTIAEADRRGKGKSAP